MRANGNFGEVTASQGGARLEPGAYSCVILAVEDGSEEANPYMGLVLQPLAKEPGKDGRRRFLYKVDVTDGENLWKHTFRFFISAFSGGVDWGRYKALVEACEQTRQNKGFAYVDQDGGEQQLVGKYLGVCFRNRKYVGQRGAHKGEVRESLEIGGVCTCDQADAGEFDQRWIAERDTTGGRGAAPATVAPAVPAPPAVPPVAPSPAPMADLAEEDIPF